MSGEVSVMMSSEHPWGQKKRKVRDRDWTTTYWQVSNVGCDIDQSVLTSINDRKFSHYVIHGACTLSMAHQPSISTSWLTHRSLMRLQDTNDWNGNMKTLLVLRDIRKGSFSVPVSIGGEVRSIWPIESPHDRVLSYSAFTLLSSFGP